MKSYFHFVRAVVFLISISIFSSCVKQAQEEKPKGDISDIAEPVMTPGWLTFKPGAKVNPKTLFKDHAALFHLPPGNEMVVQSK